MSLIFAAVLSCSDAQLLLSRLEKSRSLSRFELREVYAEVVIAAPRWCDLRAPKGVGRDFR